MEMFSPKMTKHCISNQVPLETKCVMSILLGGEKMYKSAFEKFQPAVMNIHMN